MNFPLQAKLIKAFTTDELLDELELRNQFDQRTPHRNITAQASEHIRKLRLAFSLRPGGLVATRMDS